MLERIVYKLCIMSWLVAGNEELSAISLHLQSNVFIDKESQGHKFIFLV